MEFTTATLTYESRSRDRAPRYTSVTVDFPAWDERRDRLDAIAEARHRPLDENDPQWFRLLKVAALADTRYYSLADITFADDADGGAA